MESVFLCYITTPLQWSILCSLHTTTVPTYMRCCFPICGETEETLSSTLCRFLIYFISMRYKFKFPCFIYLLNTKNGYAKKHSHHEESPEAILTLLQPPLKGRTHLYYYITSKRKIVNTISVNFLFLQKQTLSY